MNVSAPVSCPAQTCNEPAKFVTFCYLIIITTFPDIFLNTFPTPRGLIKPELLLRDINLDAATAPNDEQSLLFDAFSKNNFLTSSAMTLRRSDVALPKCRGTIILCHPSAFSLDALVPPFFLFAAFL